METIEQHYRPAEVASLTGLAIATIRRRILRREIGCRRAGRAVLIPASEVARLLGPYRAPVVAATEPASDR